MVDMSNKYTLYGAPLSLYSGKTRAYLKFKQIPYHEVFSSLKVYKKVIVPNTGVRFIPVVETPEGEFIQDTSVIMDKLEAAFVGRTVVPKGPNQQLVSALMEIWGDEWLLIPAMHYRWNHDNFPFIYEEFGKIVMPRMPAFIRRVVGKKIAAKFRGFVPMLGITHKSIPAIENWYENQVLVQLNEHFSKHDYLLGSRPCTGDFGLFGPLYAHLYRDPAPQKIMQAKAPFVVKWIERMNNPSADLGTWCVNDRIPHTLLPILEQQFAEFWPVLKSALGRTQKWIQENPDIQKLPRTIGEHSYRIGGIEEKRMISSFSQWKLQRVLDIYRTFDDKQKLMVSPLLASLGASDYMQIEIEHRVCRHNNMLVVEAR
jgi:glutathione S-transferase